MHSMKWFGAAVVFLVCSYFGISYANTYRKEEKNLRNLTAILDFMECELQYRLTPLPDLCRQAAADGNGVVHGVFKMLANELEAQISPSVSSCMNAVIEKTPNLPAVTRKLLASLGQSMGRFDLTGQLKALDAARMECRTELDKLSQNKDVRLRSYQTLGICAGAALVILFI